MQRKSQRDSDQEDERFSSFPPIPLFPLCPLWFIGGFCGSEHVDIAAPFRQVKFLVAVAPNSFSRSASPEP